MSLATRCTSCGTVFRVVQDQLKVSEGWVRCGRCESVFNALEGLLDLDRESPTGWDEAAMPDTSPPTPAPRPAPTPTPTPTPMPIAAAEPFAGRVAEQGQVSTAAPAGPIAPALLAAARVPAADEHRDEGTPSMRDELLADPIDAHLFGPRKRAESAPKPAGQVGARDRLEFSDARFDSELFEEAALPSDAEPAEPSTVADAPLESTAKPEFIRRADRDARWRSRPWRVGLVLVSVAALAALALQAGHHFRDSLAAERPALRPALAAWCRLAGCALEAPRRIDSVTVESTALARAAGQEAYVLSVNLRNRSELVLTLPAVDLSLTDGNGRLVSRRVLSARDFRASPQLAAGAEIPLQLTLSTGRTQIAGYTVEIFYP